MTDPTSPIFIRLFRKVEIVRNDMKASGNNRYHDLDEILFAGNGKIDATIGSALDIFGGHLKYEDVVAWHRNKQNQ